jgi:hypothetical protein
MLVAAAVLAVAAAVVLAVASGTLATAIAIGLFSVAGVLAMLAAFYAVGRSEDRERERETRG